ncbi:MAG: hypothetical protein ACJAQ0_001638, partial [Dasania sp.]
NNYTYNIALIDIKSQWIDKGVDANRLVSVILDFLKDDWYYSCIDIFIK